MDKQHSQKPTECFPLGQPPGSILFERRQLVSCRILQHARRDLYLKEGGPDQALKATV